MEELEGWLLIINNVSLKKVKYFIHPLKEKIENLLKDETYLNKMEI